MSEIAFVFSNHPHTPQHAATLRLMDEITTIHVCPIEGADTSQVPASPGQNIRPSTLDDVLRAPQVEAILLCTRNDLTPALLRRAVDAGKPVLFEKPGALRAADLREIAALARQHNVTLGGILPWRFHPICRQLHTFLRDGTLGDLLAVEARMVTSQVRYRDPNHWLFDPATGGGILSWLGIHWLDLLYHLLGRRVTRVTALTGHRNPERVKVEDAAMVALEYEGGVLGTLYAGYLLPGSVAGYSGAAYDNYLALRGYDGYVTYRVTATPDTYTLFSLAPGHATTGQEERRVELPPSTAYAGAHGLAFVRAFMEAARAHQPAPCPIDDLVHSLDVVEAALAAAATGQTQVVRTE